MPDRPAGPVADGFPQQRTPYGAADQVAIDDRPGAECQQGEGDRDAALEQGPAQLGNRARAEAQALAQQGVGDLAGRPQQERERQDAEHPCDLRMTEEGGRQRSNQHGHRDERAGDRQADEQRGIIAPPVRRQEHERLGNPKIGHHVGVGDEDQRDRDHPEVGWHQQPCEDDGGGQHRHLAEEE